MAVETTLPKGQHGGSCGVGIKRHWDQTKRDGFAPMKPLMKPKWRLLVIPSLIIVFGFISPLLGNRATGPSDPQEIVKFLNQTLTWYRHLDHERSVADTSDDLVFVKDGGEIASQV